MFSKILIANRGEVAVRIIRSCKEMGISTVAVYSKADSEALHVALADQSVCIGGPAATESYLNQANLISAALGVGAEAIHPGYGFLSENAAFAEVCRKHGIAFIGPPAEVISTMGDKEAARSLMKRAGVPTVPGSDLAGTVSEAKQAAAEIGFPLLIKARAGGGGKGIRLVKEEAGLELAFQTASEEAKKAFGDGGVYLEKYLSPVKHIEVQLLADEAGNVVCLGERDCSVQRKNQKLIEESPSPVLTAELRDQMMECAAKAARAAGYVSAGTVEFLLDKAGKFYFIEMNTRLQVEHPVTEMVSGIDLVKWQIRIAAGVLLDFGQDEVQLKGAAIECRINAEGGGTVQFLHIPGGPWVRFDTALYQNYTVPTYYDSMVGKLIVHAKSREEAVRKMQSALCELVIGGLPCNIEKQIERLNEQSFIDGTYDTEFIAKRGE